VEFDPARLRSGEYVVGASSFVLLASLFLLAWYGLKSQFAPTAAQLGVSTTINGWNALTNVRWLVLITVLVAGALVFFQATRPAPAIPVSLSVIVTVLALITVIVLIYRVLLDPPGSHALVSLRAGSIVGLLSAISLTYGGYVSMRREGIAPRDEPQDVEVVELGELSRS
jgi:hypothetical protein